MHNCIFFSYQESILYSFVLLLEKMRKLKNKELKRLNLKEFKNKKKLPVVIVLDNIRSSHNVGSVFRTSDAFLIKKIMLCGICPVPPKNEIRKTALGATESVEWEYFSKSTDCINILAKKGYKIISIEQADNAKYLNNFSTEKSQKMALVFGNEVNGIMEEIIQQSDEVIEIPQYGTKHSLNLSVSVGIVLWDLFLKIS